MIPFDLHRAADMQDALEAARGRPDARWVAGGTTLVDLLRLGVETPSVVIDIAGLGLDEITADAGGGLRIGALARMADVARHPLVVERYPVVAEALLAGASPQLRNMATIGGNLLQRTRCSYFRDVTFTACNKRSPGSGCTALEGHSREHAVLGTSSRCIAAHPGDLPVALVLLDAVVRTALAGDEGRAIPIGEFYVAYADDPSAENVLVPGELIVGIDLPALPHATRSRYVKARGRASFEFALASAAVALHLDGGTIREGRLALGGVATAPWRSREAEALLAGQPPARETFDAVARAALAAATPQDDNAYKVELARRVLVRALVEAARVAP